MSRQRMRVLFAALLAFVVAIAVGWGVACGSASPGADAPTSPEGPTASATSADRPAARATASSESTGPATPTTDAPHPREGLNAYLSPLTPDVVARLRSIRDAAPKRNDDVFAKVGDSATVNRAFMKCFSDSSGVTLGDHEHLAPVVERFKAARAGRSDPFRRESLAARVGWSTHHVLAGRPSPLLKEVRAISPRYAFVLFGGNELKPEENMKRYAGRIESIVDQLTSRGVIPILHTIFPRVDDPEAERLVPRYNLIIKAIAEGHGVPWIDLNAMSETLPNRGIASDGMHPSAPVRDRLVRGCDLSPAGMQFGQNMRNLLSMMMLKRLGEVLVDGKEAPDAVAPAVIGAGTTANPFVLGAVPFARRATTAGAGSSIDAYPGCAEGGDESGPEHVYRLDIDAPTTVRFTLFYGGDVDLDLHLLGERAEGGACVARADRDLTQALEPGVHHLVVDTFRGVKQAGPYVLVATPETPETPPG